VTRDHKAGVQTGEMVLVTQDGIERMHDVPRGFLHPPLKGAGRRTK
jgi:hypothetical protein